MRTRSLKIKRKTKSRRWIKWSLFSHEEAHMTTFSCWVFSACYQICFIVFISIQMRRLNGQGCSKVYLRENKKQNSNRFIFVSIFVGNFDKLVSSNVILFLAPLKHCHVREMSICKLSAHVPIVFSSLLQQTGCAVPHCYDCNTNAYTRLGWSTATMTLLKV